MTTSTSQNLEHSITPYLTPALEGRALPDQVRLSLFANFPTAECLTDASKIFAEAYFRRHPGAVPFDGEEDPQGPGFSWKEGAVTFRFHTRRSISMTVIFNPQRIVMSRHEPGGGRDRHGNLAVRLLDQGYDVSGLRHGMCEDICEVAQKARRRYSELCEKAFGVSAEGAVMANYSLLEATYDIHADASLLDSYRRAFGKLFGANESAKLSGSLRKGERFAIYAKPRAEGGQPVVRFESAISGARIKELIGSQRVPGDVAGVEAVLDAVEKRCMPVWLEVERHRVGGGGVTFGQLATRLPRTPNRDLLELVAGQLGLTGRIASNPRNRSLLSSLLRARLIENPCAVTRVRGVRITTPEADGFWQAWGRNS